MGYKAMAWAVEQDVSSTHAFAVLVALASHANDDTLMCWPSQKRLAEQTKQSVRSVRNQLQNLTENGYIENSENRAYKILLKRKEVPQKRKEVPLPKAERGSPKAERVSQKAERGSPEPVRTSKEYNNSKKAKQKNTLEKPCEIDPQTWDDFLSLRARKKAPLTETALSRISTEAKKANWTLEDAVSECCARGWTGFKSDWVEPKKQSNQFSLKQMEDLSA